MLSKAVERGVLFVITGPSGVGKSTLIEYVREHIPELGFSVSATTRARRPGEVDGEDYHFLDEASFLEKERNGDFLESATVYNHRYGTLRSAVDTARDLGQSIVLDIDVLGARQIRERCSDAVFIFILPPNIDTLETRLRARGTDSEDIIQRRMDQVAKQIEGCGEFHYLVINDDLSAAKQNLLSIVKAELCRVSVRQLWVARALEDVSRRAAFSGHSKS